MYYYRDECFIQHNDISFSKYRYKRKSLEHKHDFFEIAYVSDGEGYHIIDGESYPIAKGDYMILDTVASHCYDGDVEITNLIFNPKFLDKNYRDMTAIGQLYGSLTFNTGYSITVQEPLYHIYHDDGEIFGRIEYIHGEIEQKKLGYAECVRGALLEIIMRSVRSICREDMSGSGDSNVEFIERYIYEHYDEDVSLSLLCKEMGYSLPYISKRFKAVTGSNFSDYLQKTRIHFACRFFINSPDSGIEDVAARVGYSDIKHFTAVFKKYTNTTPGMFLRGIRHYHA